MKNEITISILCGGKSSRMQTEKGLVKYKSKRFIEWVIDAALPISENIQLITNSNDYNYLKYRKIVDIIKEKGPLGGIYTALSHSETELNLILSCDLPLISNQILEELTQKHSNSYDVSVFNEGEKIHPLIGIYDKRILPIIEEYLKKNQLKMMHLLSMVNCQKIKILKDQRLYFTNVNTPFELNELNAKLVNI